MSTKQKVLVTGGAGFIGSHVVDRLTDQGHYDVTVMDNLVTGRLENLTHHGEAVRFINADISAPSAWEALNFIPDYIIHLAAQVSVPASFEDPAYCHRVNVSGFLNMLDFARVSKVKKVVYASSSAIYGDQGERKIKESDTPNPLSPYGASKLLNEWYAAKYHQWFGVSSIGLRFFNVYGPRQLNDSPYSGVIAKFTICAKAKKPIMIFGDGDQTRDYVFVADVAEIVSLSMLSAISCEVLNVGTGHSKSLLEIVEYLTNIFGRKINVEFSTARVGDIKHSAADISKQIAELGFLKHVDLQDGLKTLIAASK